MKIGIVSDTHDNLGKIKTALAAFKAAGVETILHAGDICSPFSLLAFKKEGINLQAVFGNNDGDWLLLTKVIEGGGQIAKGPIALEIGGRKIALMHEPVFPDALADSGHFDLVVYGHTHDREEKRRGKALILNPGEASGYLGAKATAMIVDLETLSVETLEL